MEDFTFSGKKLTALRKEKGFTQQQLADAIGVTRRMITYHEYEAKRIPSDLLLKICATLQVPTNILIGESTTKMDGRSAEGKIQKKMRLLSKLPQKDRNLVFQMIDHLVTGQNEPVLPDPSK